MEAKNQDGLKLIALLLIAALCVIAGGFLGASTNAVNGAVSPEYFRKIMGWDHVQHIWLAAIAQGILEGLIYGVMFSIVFTLVVGIVSRVKCGFVFAFRYLVGILLAIYCCWAIGGILAMGLASLSPEFYRNTFIGVPESFVPMLRYAWVGGSIWGAMFGGLLSLVIGCVLFAAGWRRHQLEIAG